MFVDRFLTACFDPRKVEERIHEFEQAKAIAMGELNVLANFGRNRLGRPGKNFLERPKHERQRCPELMTDVAEKLGFGPIQLRERFRALALLLIRKRVSNGRENVIRSEFEKSAIGIIECAAGADPEDQDPIGLRLPRAQERSNSGGVSSFRVRPPPARAQNAAADSAE